MSEIKLAPGETKELDVEVLNTITCKLGGKDWNMICEIDFLKGGKIHSFGKITDVYSVGGDIQVLEGTSGNIWIKSHPFLGLPCKIKIRNRGESDYPKGKDITVICRGKGKIKSFGGEIIDVSEYGAVIK